MLTFGSRTGRFATINGLALGNPFDPFGCAQGTRFAQGIRGKQFNAAYTATNLTLNVTAVAPIPALPDSDGDGIPDAQELLAPSATAQGAHGTDPHDPASALRITQLEKSATGMQMQFPTKPGNPSTHSTALRAPAALRTPNLSPRIHRRFENPVAVTKETLNKASHRALA